MEVISWLGAYFVKEHHYEKAMQFFQRASQIQPAEVKWKLMVASCHRRVQDYDKASRRKQKTANSPTPRAQQHTASRTVCVTPAVFHLAPTGRKC